MLQKWYYLSIPLSFISPPNIETQATTDNTGYVTLEMLHKMAKQPIFRRTTITRPLSEATEILDTDFESDYDNSYDDDSSRRSVASVSS